MARRLWLLALLLFVMSGAHAVAQQNHAVEIPARSEEKPATLRPAEQEKRKEASEDGAAPLPRSGAEPAINGRKTPPPPSSSHDSNEDIIAKFTIVLAVATILLMLATGFLWWETRKLAKMAREQGGDFKASLEVARASAEHAARAADYAGEQVSLSNKLFETTERPWLYAKVSLSDDARVIDEALWANIAVSVHNTGKTAATNVWVAGRIHLGNGGVAFWDASDAFAAEMRENFEKNLGATKPGSTFRAVLPGEISEFELQCAADEFDRKDPPTSAALVGAITYRSAISDSIRQTTFVWELVSSGRGFMDIRTDIIRNPNREILLPSLVLRRYFTGENVR